MPSAPADRRLRAGHPRLWSAGLLLCALLFVVFVSTRGTTTAVLPSGPDPTAVTPASTRQVSAARLLNRLSKALRHGSRAQVLALAQPGNDDATRELSGLFDNVRAMGIIRLSMRYVDEANGGFDAAQQKQLGADGWVADVELRWRIADYDRSASETEIQLGLVKTPEGAAFVTSRTDFGAAAPLWLQSDVEVERTNRSLVVVAEPDQLNSAAGQARTAVSDVTRVLPQWDGKLVVEFPSTQQQLNRVLAARDHDFDSIAAVTTTVGGSVSPSAPAHVFVNPAVFDGLGEQGAQIVISHEATHVAVGAATSSMPTWLLEGFADYVALAEVDLPETTTASQILRNVRQDGVPARLPGAKEFASSNPGLGATYEGAWLACRLLAERYGEQRLIAFYRQSDRDAATDRAFAEQLQTSEGAFTREWQTYLRQLAT